MHTQRTLMYMDTEGDAHIQRGKCAHTEHAHRGRHRCTHTQGDALAEGDAHRHRETDTCTQTGRQGDVCTQREART